MNVPTSPYELNPGDVISISADDLPAFENWLAYGIDENMNPNMIDAWAGRIALVKLIRPPKFDGSIGMIYATVQEDPYDQLFTAVSRGWRFPRLEGRGMPVKRSKDPSLSGRFIGFVINAAITATRYSGELTTEIWYGPVSNNSNGSKWTAGHGGQSVQRYVAEARMSDTDSYRESQRVSSIIAWEILREKTTYPINIGMHN